MGDLDVLVPESQTEQAGWALESLSYTRSSPRSADAHPVFRPYHETFTSEAGRALELPWRIGPSRWRPAAEASRWFERCAPILRRFGGLLVAWGEKPHRLPSEPAAASSALPGTG